MVVLAVWELCLQKIHNFMGDNRMGMGGKGIESRLYHFSSYFILHFRLDVCDT